MRELASNKVNLFLVGAMKAGTTRLCEIMQQHPAIYVSPIKEPHFFVDALPEILYEPSPFFSLERYFKKEFPKPLHIASVTQQEHYDLLFSLRKEEPYAMEASTMYLHEPNVAERIHTYNPNAKIIIITREPYDRCESHYRMLVGLSRETRSFETVMKEEIKAYHDGTLPWYSCLGMSFYNEPIDRYTQLFSEVLVLDFESLNQDEAGTLQKLSAFLAIPSFDQNSVGVVNKTRTLRFKWLFYLLKKLGGKAIFSAIFGKRFKQAIFKRLSTDKKQEITLSQETFLAAQAIFKSHST